MKVNKHKPSKLPPALSLQGSDEMAPDLGHCVYNWASFLREDTLSTEGVQLKFTRLNPRIRICPMRPDEANQPYTMQNLEE